LAFLIKKWRWPFSQGRAAQDEKAQEEFDHFAPFHLSFSGSGKIRSRIDGLKFPAVTS
jgi:hypothetical protein